MKTMLNSHTENRTAGPVIYIDVVASTSISKYSDANSTTRDMELKVRNTKNSENVEWARVTANN